MENILPWLALKDVKGIGNHLFKKLLDTFRTPEAVFQASRNELLQLSGVSPPVASAILSYKTSDTVKKEIDLAHKHNAEIITMHHPLYPELLHQLPDPPPYLYIFGTLEASINNIAVVGSRSATTYGTSTTKRLCHDLAALKINVISGMARGIDTAAHLGAIQGSGKTFAILGSGLGKIYPPENKKLFYQISETGAVISEFPIMATPEPYHFPQRNRIISGMSLGTVVVEAAQKSGSLITAQLAAEQGREVFAVPGSIHSFKSAGTHKLLKQGAKLVENVNDIIEELAHILHYDNKIDNGHPHSMPVILTPAEQHVFNVLEPYPIHIDDIMRKTGVTTSQLSGILLKLELSGIVKQTPGKLFYICEEPK